MDVKKMLGDDVHGKLMGILQRAPYIRCEDVHRQYAVNWLMNNGVTVQEGKDNDVPTKWVPATERLPETCGYPVLMVAVNKYGQKKIVKGFTNYECPVEFCTNEKEYDLCWHCWEVTHWMHLPEPPKGGGESGC